MTNETIIPQTVNPVAIEVPFPVEPENLPVTLIARGLTGPETCKISISADNGISYEPWMAGAIPVQLDAANNTLVIRSAMFLGVLKDPTANPASVSATY